jgi:hypothetical protein
MSINALANAAAARRSDTAPENAVPSGLHEIARAAASSPVAAGQPAPSSAFGAGQAVETAINVLFGYIPTEILTLYVAVLAAIQQPNKVTSADWAAFWAFLAGTPLVVWLVYGAKIKALQKPLPVAFSAWPVWEMLAATLAYVAWAMALPNTPFAAYAWYSSALAGVTVLVASTVLGLLAPFFQHQIAVTAG